jgi:hypothetical protein
MGTYAWGQSLWKNSDMEVINFLSSDVGQEWQCGDLSINVGDYSAPTEIRDSQFLAPWIISYRQNTGNDEAVVWLTYGDVVSDNGALMVQFVSTFFDWAASISADDAAKMGKIGLSFDVEHIDPEFTKEALQKAQSLKSSTKFASGNILVQHTIEGQVNLVGTDYVMKYADSALMMLYRNYEHDPSGVYHDDSNINSRMAWMLQQQCTHCLDDTYANANYQAKITVMVEASCNTGEYCGKISFCAFDGANQGAEYMWDILTQMNDWTVSSGLMTSAQHSRLFNPLTTFSAHDWSWYRCFAPFSNSLSYSDCSNYHTMAATCRSE